MALQHIRDLEPLARTQEVALYSWGDRFVVVSTVDLSARYQDADEAQRAIMSMGDMAGAMLGKPTRDPHAEDSIETMAFYSDPTGQDWDYSEIVVAHGHDSRERVLERLEELEPGAYGEVA